MKVSDSIEFIENKIKEAKYHSYYLDKHRAEQAINDIKEYLNQNN